MSQQPLPIERNYLKRYKKPILVSLAIIIVVIVLVSPIVPIQYTVTKTRTRDLRYSSEVYGTYNIPKFVNVTNTDSIGGGFSVTMNMWLNNPLGQSQLQDTSTQYSFIRAGATQAFYLPSDWFIFGLYSLTYSVSAPSTQETYDVTQTEYKSILNLIAESLRKQ